MKQLILGIYLALFAAASARACGISEICDDVAASVTGVLVVGDGITIDWGTDSEDSTLDRYELHRYDCPNANLCLVSVATISARGTCSNNEEYTYNDNPPDPDEDWTYRIEIFKDGISAPQCTYDVAPE